MKSLPENMVATQVIRQSGSPGSLHVFELSHERAVDKKLLLLVEIEVSDKDNEGIVEDIAREIEQEFFNAPTKETEYAFENALAKANIRVKDTLLVKPKNWLNRMHVIVLALAGPEAYLASVGMVHAFLVHREKIVDVLRSPDGHAAPPNPLKLFTNIVSGKLGPETAMVLANESVLDYLSVERIRKCAQEFDAQEAAEALTELLAQAPSNKQFGLAVVSPLPRPLPETVIPDRPLRAPLTRQYAPFEPAYGRYGEEEEADAYPSGAPEEPYERFDSSGRATRALLGTLLVASQAALTVLLSLLAKLLEGLQLLIKRTGPALASFARATLATVRNAESRTYFLRRVKDAAGNAAYRAMHAPSRKRQLAGAAVAVLAVVFVASVLLRASKQNREQASTDFQAGISEIELKIGEAEASLIYGNKIKSQTVLAEAQASLAALAHEFPDEEERLAAAALSIESLQNRAEKKQPITAIQVVATVIPAPIGPNEAGLVQLGD
ncbi:MAG: hypothetical protein HYW81_02420 [Parcubacteria group bacterium]|nr:hypothetical protein [Parcubacteria group bacterium]